MICYKCHGLGIMKNGEPCDCSTEVKLSTATENMGFIPGRYLNVKLDQTLIPPVVDEYPKELMDFHNSILRARILKRNHFLYAPANSSKTVLVYSVLQTFFIYRIPIYPYFDIDEIKLIMTLLDNNDRDIPYMKDTGIDPYTLFEVPVLFVKAPIRSTVSTYETLSKLMDRRLRRGLGTCIISDVPWIAFTYQDRFKVIRNLEGNGTFKSINVMEYAKREV